MKALGGRDDGTSNKLGTAWFLVLGVWLRFRLAHHACHCAFPGSRFLVRDGFAGETIIVLANQLV